MSDNPLMEQPKFIELMAGMKVGLVPLSLVHNRRTNYRKMTVEQERQLRASIDKFGFRTLVVLQTESNGTYGIIDGHHRVAEATRRGMPEIPAVVLEVSALDADLGMFSFNVTAETIPSEYYDFIKELQITTTNEELSQHTGLSQEFLMDLRSIGVAQAAAADSISGQAEGEQEKPAKQRGKKLVILSNEHGIQRIFVVPETFDVPAKVHNLVEDMGLILTTHVVGSLQTVARGDDLLKIIQLELRGSP